MKRDLDPSKFESPEDYLLAELEEFAEKEHAKSLLHHRKRLRGEKDGPMKPASPEECAACAKGECEDPSHLPDDVGYED